MKLEQHQKFDALCHWQNLQKTHRQSRQWNLEEALVSYQRILESRIERYFPPHSEAWPIYPNEDRPSINWGCLYLAEYCFLNRNGWVKWRKLSATVFNSTNFLTLPEGCRSRLISTQGMADFNRPGIELTSIAAIQHETLATLKLTSFEQALHHNVLGLIYQQIRQPELAFKHLELANSLIDPSEEPFYAMEIKETTASTYYFLNNFDESYYDKSLELYGELLGFAEATGQTSFVMRELYNIGWVYAETKRYEQAWDYFHRAYRLAHHKRLTSHSNDGQNDLDFEIARYLYGKGYALIMLNEIEEGVALLCEAASSFDYLNADLMTAVSLQLVAGGYQTLKQYGKGLAYAERSLDLQRRIDSPVQLYHIIVRMMELHFKLRHPKRSLQYFLEYRRLKRQIQK